MQFSDTVTYNGIIQDIDFLLFGDGTTQNDNYSIYDRTRNVNITYDELTAELFKADPNFMWDDTTNEDFPIAKTTLVANQTNYSIPTGSLVVNRLRMFDKSGNLKTLKPVQRRELNDSELSETGEPRKYYKIDNAFFPVPIPDYGGSNGVEFEFQRSANHFSYDDTDKKPGFASIFHQYLSIGAALRYAVSNGMTDKVGILTEMKNTMLASIQQHYQRRAPDRPPSLKLKRRNVNGYGLR